MELSRRDLLKLGLFSSAALMLPAERVARTKLASPTASPPSQLPAALHRAFAVPPVLDAGRSRRSTPTTTRSPSSRSQPRSCRASRRRSGATTASRPGPTISRPHGRKARRPPDLRLPDRHPTLGYNVWTLDAPARLGVAAAVRRLRQRHHEPGPFKDYHYPNIQDARTLWYHDHGVHITAQNAYMGLAAQYILHDPLEHALPIPHGQLRPAADPQGRDVPGQRRPASSTTTTRSGIYGDVILVNGVPWPAMQVERRKYRFRILNASVSRSYDLALDTGEPLTVIGTDGGLMPAPQPCAHVQASAWPSATRSSSTSRSTRPGQRVVLQEHQPEEQHRLRHDRRRLAFVVGAHVTDPRNNEIPQDLNPNMRVMGLAGVRREDDPPHALRAQGRAAGRSTARHGRTSSTATTSSRSPTRPRRRRDLGAREPARRLVPPGPHPPRRLQGPRPQRPAAGALRAGPEGRRLRRRGREGPRDHALREPGRPVHDALPQPRPRGPRHDGPVRGRRRRPRSDHRRPRRASRRRRSRCRATMQTALRRPPRRPLRRARPPRPRAHARRGRAPCRSAPPGCTSPTPHRTCASGGRTGRSSSRPASGRRCSRR